MSTDRIAVVEGRLADYLASAAPADVLLDDDASVGGESSLTAGAARLIFEDQCLSRAIDAKARRMKADGTSFYTISSAGHEQNAVLGRLLRSTDPCFLHYRSGAFMMARGRKGTRDPVQDTMLSICASSDDPIAQGRHKVWGSRPLWVPPQTSTIASHLPKAVGMAFAIGRSKRLEKAGASPDDAIACCTFGDASANHATALAGLNAARYGLRRGNPVPILFVCEDNGIGISVDTPGRWIEDSFGTLPHLRYIKAEGPLDEVWRATSEAVDTCRTTRAPVFLHLKTVRLWGHAGSDIELAYRSQSDIDAAEAEDPILANARFLVERGAATPESLQTTVASARTRVEKAATDAATRPHLDSASAVTAPLAPYDEAAVVTSASGSLSEDARNRLWSGDLPEDNTSPVKRTMAAHLSAALREEMARRPEVVVFGEDVGKKGGVYYVTAGLQKAFGTGRVFDTQLDETSILGLAQGLGLAGQLPVPEIQYLAYIHNALDQVRGEACSTGFFSTGQFSNPMVIRIAGLAYQKGFGGHFHNDNSIGGLRDIPGLIMAVPSRGDDAVRMLRGCIATARECGRVVAFIEPIALYHEKDLYEPGDEGWLFRYPTPGTALTLGEVGVYGSGSVLLVTYGNGVRLSLRAARTLRAEHGLKVAVLDVRWLNPLPLEEISQHAAGRRHVVVVDECRATAGGIADAVVAHLAEGGFSGRLGSVRAVDTYVPLGPAANTVLVQEQDIVDGVLAVTQ
ncbi:MAG: thiamine pyrophosphate-dependent enzyme [Longimicrobiales bacterium]